MAKASLTTTGERRCGGELVLTGAAPEQPVGGVVGRPRPDVLLHAVELTVVERPQQVSGGPQHRSPLGRGPAVGRPRKRRQLDVVKRLKQVEDLRGGNNDRC